MPGYTTGGNIVKGHYNYKLTIYPVWTPKSRYLRLCVRIICKRTDRLCGDGDTFTCKVQKHFKTLLCFLKNEGVIDNTCLKSLRGCRLLRAGSPGHMIVFLWNITVSYISCFLLYSTVAPQGAIQT